MFAVECLFPIRLPDISFVQIRPPLLIRRRRVPPRLDQVIHNSVLRRGKLLGRGVLGEDGARGDESHGFPQGRIGGVVDLEGVTGRDAERADVVAGVGDVPDRLESLVESFLVFPNALREQPAGLYVVWRRDKEIVRGPGVCESRLIRSEEPRVALIGNA